MSNTKHNQGNMQSTMGGRDTTPGNAAPDGERQGRKPSRFGWLFDEAIFQALLLVAVLVALADGVSSVNNMGIV
ncbi:MAG TPA: hypothetical protein VF329_14870 [Gammaproteobacteria bacterium]